jgi:D-amino peptidase
MWKFPLLVMAASVAAASALAAQAPRPLKVYISVDLEGVAGVVTGEQLSPSGFEYQRARQFMTDEALAAVQGAREAGATEIVVSDSHGNGQNLLIEQFPADVTIIRSWPRPLMMMEGIDSTFQAAIFVGYHASTGSLDGVRAHTMSSANLTAVSLNGREVPEGGMNAAIAGHFGVPVVLVTGDNAAVAELRQIVPTVQGAVVKRAISFHAAATMTPKAAQDLIRAAARTAVSGRQGARPFVLSTPVTLEVGFKNYRVPEMLAYLPMVERTTSHRIRFVGRDIVVVSRFLEFINTYQPDLAP